MQKSRSWGLFAKITILIITSILSMAFAGCIVIDFSYDDYTSFIIVNNYTQTINSMKIIFIDSGHSFDGYLLENVNFPKGTSKKQYLDRIDKAFNAEVIVRFGSEYDIKQYRFAPNETTVIALNENGILE